MKEGPHVVESILVMIVIAVIILGAAVYFTNDPRDIDIGGDPVIAIEMKKTEAGR